MSEFSLTQQKGNGYLRHNNRDFSSDNIKKERTKDNITLKKQTLQDAYEECFGKSVADYNAKQKRSDRQIDDYFKSMFNHSANEIASQSVLTAKDKTNSFYEDIVQIGDKDNCNVTSDNGNIACLCLLEYAEGFQERNPNFHVFNSVIHMDEQTPHLHLDYIPIATGYSKGMAVRNGYNKALESMGYKGADGFKKWRENEREVFGEICAKHGLQPQKAEKNRGKTYTPEQYKQIISEAEAQSSILMQNARDILEQAEEKDRIIQEKAKMIDDELQKHKQYSQTLDRLVTECQSDIIRDRVAKTLANAPVTHSEVYESNVSPITPETPVRASESVTRDDTAKYFEEKRNIENMFAEKRKQEELEKRKYRQEELEKILKGSIFNAPVITKDDDRQY